jgi:betaine-aldehyde dehydrogenase
MPNGDRYSPPDLARRVQRWLTQVVQAESFGPVMTVERFTDEADAVRIANDTMYRRIGRELRRAGLAEHRETKHIWQNVRPEAQRWFSG